MRLLLAVVLALGFQAAGCAVGKRYTVRRSMFIQTPGGAIALSCTSEEQVDKLPDAGAELMLMVDSMTKAGLSP